ncbi:MAG TPA: 5-deoxy-glucuronate isomerase [Acidimicrobiales bacterium]|nr:5-deoxy-glucuronate isomerase [Acidimicrobiales bacterium]
MSHPLHLPYGGSADGLDRVVVTPQSAGWSYAGLRIVELAPGQSRRLSTGTDEMVVLPLAGSCTVECEGSRFELTGRSDVFSRVTDFAYVPIDAEVLLSSGGGGRFALPSARATRRLDPAYGAADAVPVEQRGAGRATRQLNNFCDPVSFPADKLIAVECITPAGNWSSYPPHKHDEARSGEAVLEEIYYFETATTVVDGARQMGRGFAMQRLYTSDGQIDLCEEVHQGDVVLIPRGYHGPSMTAPGYDLYYLNVLAGPAEDRTMAFCDDPDHHWIRQTWQDQEPDPRLPLATASGPT